VYYGKKKFLSDEMTMINVYFILDQHIELDIDTCPSLKQQSTGRHVALLEHIILMSPM
jgi:hypothetical protein